MHAFENQFMDRMRFAFFEATHQIRSKLDINISDIENIPTTDILIFVCKKELLKGPQTILASRMSSPSGRIYIYLPAGEYWAYWIPIENSEHETIHRAYTSIYKSPDIAQKIGCIRSS